MVFMVPLHTTLFQKHCDLRNISQASHAVRQNFDKFQRRQSMYHLRPRYIFQCTSISRRGEGSCRSFIPLLCILCALATGVRRIRRSGGRRRRWRRRLVFLQHLLLLVELRRDLLCSRLLHRKCFWLLLGQLRRLPVVLVCSRQRLLLRRIRLPVILLLLLPWRRRRRHTLAGIRRLLLAPLRQCLRLWLRPRRQRLRRGSRRGHRICGKRRPALVVALVLIDAPMCGGPGACSPTDNPAWPWGQLLLLTCCLPSAGVQKSSGVVLPVLQSQFCTWWGRVAVAAGVGRHCVGRLRTTEAEPSQPAIEESGQVC